MSDGEGGAFPVVASELDLLLVPLLLHRLLLLLFAFAAAFVAFFSGQDDDWDLFR